MAFTPLGDALKGKIGAQKNIEKQLEATAIVDAAEAVFKEVFSEDLAPHAKPLFLKNRTLTVTCTSSALAQEIRLRQSEIVAKINDKLGKSEVDRIRYLA
jgi:predicted nucleic acid-binding Zn ribbon protein